MQFSIIIILMYKKNLGVSTYYILAIVAFFTNTGSFFQNLSDHTSQVPHNHPILPNFKYYFKIIKSGTWPK